MAKYYRNPLNGQHIPFKDNKWLTGTLRYASVNTHLGVEQSRRDDLESLGYVFIYLLNGHLPWMGVRGSGKQEKKEKIMEIKLSVSVERLCQKLPSSFNQLNSHYI